VGCGGLRLWTNALFYEAARLKVLAAS
jgi:hypothetical protein